jgi:Uma2 family endonuclease
MGVPVIDTGPFTVEDFYAFTDRRPDEEKWELIDGDLILNASPASQHQFIVVNILYALTSQLRERRSRWVAIPGIGALVSNTSRPEPDIMILPDSVLRAAPGSRDTTEAIILFEIMSPSTIDRDLKWKRAAYTGMPKLTHYVVVAQDMADVVVFARDNGFAEQRLARPEQAVEFPALGIALPLSEIYRDTGLL